MESWLFRATHFFESNMTNIDTFPIKRLAIDYLVISAAMSWGPRSFATVLYADSVADQSETLAPY